MLRLKVITHWCDLNAELDSASLGLSHGEEVNLNLLRRSVVFWKRATSGVPSQNRQDNRYAVSFNREQLEQLGEMFDRTQEAILSRSPAGLKVACAHVLTAMTIVDLAHVSSRTDSELVSMVRKVGPISLRKGLKDAVRLEAMRRGLLTGMAGE